MAPQHRTRYSTPRRSFEDEQFVRNEQEPAFMHAEPVRLAPALYEQIGGAVFECCGTSRCTCPTVDELRKAGAL